MSFHHYNEIAEEAAAGGYSDIVLSMLARGANNYNKIAIAAARYGHSEIVDLAVEAGASAMGKIVAGAAESGSLDIIEKYWSRWLDPRAALTSAAEELQVDVIRWIIDQLRFPELYYDDIAQGAARGGHMELTKQMIEWGAEDFASIANNAASNGHWDIVDYLLETHPPLDYDTLAIEAAKRGEEDRVTQMIDLGASDYDMIAISAARGCTPGDSRYHQIIDSIAQHIHKTDIVATDAADKGCWDIVNIMIRRGITVPYTLVQTAASVGNWELVEQLDFDSNPTALAQAAASQGRIDIIERLLDRDDIDLTDVARAAAADGQVAVVDFIIDLARRERVRLSYNDIAIAAVGGSKGDPDLIVKLVTYGATNLLRIAEAAGGRGYDEIVDRMIEMGVTNYTRIAIGAAKYGREEVVDDMLRRGATINNKLVRTIIRSGLLRVVDRLIDQGLITNFDTVAESAAYMGYTGLVKEAIRSGATNFNEMAEASAQWGYLPIVKEVISRFDGDSTELALTAANMGWMNVVDFLVEAGVTTYTDIALLAIDQKYLTALRILLRGDVDYEKLANKAIDDDNREALLEVVVEASLSDKGMVLISQLVADNVTDLPEIIEYAYGLDRREVVSILEGTSKTIE